MKHRLFAFVSILCLMVSMIAVLAPPKVAAASSSASDIESGRYAFQDRGNIIGKFNTSGTVDFSDKDITDSTYNYAPPSGGGFCNPGRVQSYARR